MTNDTEDPLLDQLRALPPHPVDPAFDARAHQEARRAFVRSASGAGGDAASSIGRVLMPVFLAMVVGLYMTWAIASATALVQ